MMRTAIKWMYRCLGWIALACLAFVLLSTYAMDKKVGYGQLEIRPVWQGEAYPLDRETIASADLLVRNERRPLEPGKAMRLRPGPVMLQMKLKDFDSCSVTTNVVKDADVVVELPLTAEARMITVGNLMSNSMLNGQSQAGVWILKNAAIGQTYQIEVATAGYYTDSLSLRIERPGTDLVTNLVWRPLMGFVSARITPSIDGTTFLIDGHPVSFPNDTITVGAHLLSVSNSNYLPWNQHISVEYGLTNHCDIVLNPKPASLSVEVSPPMEYQLLTEHGDLVELNDGIANLEPGTNVLVLSSKWCASQRRTFVTEPNGHYSWKVQLVELGAELQQIVTLSQAHLRDELIITFIHQSGKSYALSADRVIALSSQGVSQPVIAALLAQKGASGGLSRPETIPAAQTIDTGYSQPQSGTNLQLQKGDILVSIDGRSVKGMSRRDVSERMKSAASIVILRKGSYVTLSESPAQGIRQ